MSKNKTQHTPGPWKPREYKTKNGGIWIDCNAFANNGKGRMLGGTVCEVLDLGASLQQANVRLISVAPDLLAALEDTIQAIQRERTASDNYNRLGGNFPSDEDDDNRELETASDEYEAASVNLIQAEHKAIAVIVRAKGGA